MNFYGLLHSFFAFLKQFFTFLEGVPLHRRVSGLGHLKTHMENERDSAEFCHVSKRLRFCLLKIIDQVFSIK